MEIKLSADEFNWIAVSTLGKVLPAVIGLSTISLVEGGCVVKGEYDKGTGVRWSLKVRLCMSEDGKMIGLRFCQPNLDSWFCSLIAPSPEEMKAMLLDKVSGSVGEIEGLDLEGDVLWVNVEGLFKKFVLKGLGFGLNISELKFSVSPETFRGYCTVERIPSWLCLFRQS